MLLRAGATEMVGGSHNRKNEGLHDARENSHSGSWTVLPSTYSMSGLNVRAAFGVHRVSLLTHLWCPVSLMRLSHFSPALVAAVLAGCSASMPVGTQSRSTPIAEPVYAVSSEPRELL